MPGTIYLVATPLGNLEDITLRALRVLKEVDIIACEDTRHTRRLLTHFEIQKPLLSYHEHNEKQRAIDLVQRALAGASIAVVSNAGMPGISDPGYRVVRRALAESVTVIPVPGPVSAEAALAASGLPTATFHFGGFLPPKPVQRRKVLEALITETATLVFYEAPHRILATLGSVIAVLGDRPVVIARELTKVHEEFLRGTASEVTATLRSRPSIKGEITLLIGRPAGPAVTGGCSKQGVTSRVAELIENEKMSRMNAIKRTAQEHGLSKQEAYRLLESEL